MWKTLLAIALGGACGSVARWAITRGLIQQWGPAFPWGTWAVNVMGGVLIGGLSIHLTQGRLSPTGHTLYLDVEAAARPVGVRAQRAAGVGQQAGARQRTAAAAGFCHCRSRSRRRVSRSR